MEKAVGTGRARTMVVLRSRAIQRNFILMEDKWKWLVGKTFVSCEEVTPQRKNCFDRLYYLQHSPVSQFDTRKRFWEYLPTLLTAAVTYSGIYMLCGMRAHSARLPRIGEES